MEILTLILQCRVPGAFVNNYNQFPGTEGGSIPLGDHDLFTRVLDDAKDDFMLHDISNDEVKSVIFSMGDIGLRALTVLLLLSLRKHGTLVLFGIFLQ
nr:hypothetical protein [Tanacetum cinerariifolium]